MEETRALGLAADLHNLADFVEIHHEVLPEDLTVSAISYLYSFGDASVPQVCADTMKAALKHGAEIKKEYETSTFYLKMKFGHIQYKIMTMRNNVCDRKVIGTEEVEIKTAIDWEVTTTTKDVVEWDCHPLLGASTDG